MAFVATAKPDLALAFYRDVLELTLVEDSPFAVVFDAFGTTLRVQKVEAVTLAPYTSFGLEVEDVDAAARAIVGKGAELVRYPHLEQDALGIWGSPGGARVCWFKDPDGNVLSLTQLTRPATG